MALFSSKKKKKEDELPPLDWPPQGQGGQGGSAAQSWGQQNPGQDQFPYRQQQPGQYPSSQQPFPQGQQPGGYDQFQAPQQDFSQNYGQSPQPPLPQPSPQYGYGQQSQDYGSSSAGGYSADDERIEEIAEAIIDEKWQELVKDVKKVIDWKDTVESKMDHLDQEIRDLKVSMDNMQKALFGKIADYDKSISDVGTEIKAMEKVFQKILPTLTESVNKLDRMSQNPGGKGKR